MAVRCPRCQRAYAEDLFSYGRVIDCSCGSPVRLPCEETPPAGSSDLRFVADAMLGRLAHWLRLFGFDTIWSNDLTQAGVARSAWEGGRIAVTRSRSLGLRWQLPRLIVLASEALPEQLIQLQRETGLAQHARPLVRCSHCNDLLEEIAPESVGAAVPERVRCEQDHFRRCRRCGRIYWEGSHARRIRQELWKLAADV